MTLWPLAVHLGAAVLLAVIMIGLSWFLGERHRGRATDQPYESGMAPTGSSRVPFSAKFYLIAVFFVIFDLEAVFLFAWAVAAPDVGWAGYFEVVVFVGVLLAALVYLWRVGALDWGPRPRRRALGRRRGGPELQPGAVREETA